MSFLGWLGASIAALFMSLFGATFGLTPRPVVSPTASAQVLSSTTSVTTARALDQWKWISLSATSTLESEHFIIAQDGSVQNFDETTIASSTSSILVAVNDAGTFGGFIKTNNQVWALFRSTEWEQLQNVDPLSFIVLAPYVGEDKNGLWSGSAQLPFSVDEATFASIGDEDGAYYYKDRDYVYCLNAVDAICNNIVTGADPNTFVLLSASTTVDASDKNHQYFEGEMVQGNSQTSATTTILDAQGNPSEYFKDSEHVYYDGSDDPNHPAQIVSNYPDAFGALSFNDLYSDGHQVFQWGQVISNDAAHFVRVQIPESQYLCAKDSHQFYECSNESAEIDPIVGSDPASFTLLVDANGKSTLYAKDKNLVYWFGESSEGLSGPNLSIVSGADASTFAVVEGQANYDAQDKNHKYLDGQVVQ